MRTSTAAGLTKSIRIEPFNDTEVYLLTQDDRCISMNNDSTLTVCAGAASLQR